MAFAEFVAGVDAVGNAAKGFMGGSVKPAQSAPAYSSANANPYATINLEGAYNAPDFDATNIAIGAAILIGSFYVVKRITK